MLTSKVVSKTVTLFLMALAAFTLVSCHSRSEAVTSDQAKSEIQAIYDAQNNGYATMDTAAILSHLSSDFVVTSFKGVRQTPPQMRAVLKQLFANAKNMKSTTTITSVTVTGSQAIVTTSNSTDFQLAIVPPSKPHQTMPAVLHQVHSQNTTRDQWTLGKNGWECHQSQELTETNTTDGKPT